MIHIILMKCELVRRKMDIIISNCHLKKIKSAGDSLIGQFKVISPLIWYNLCKLNSLFLFLNKCDFMAISFSTINGGDLFYWSGYSDVYVAEFFTIYVGSEITVFDGIDRTEMMLFSRGILKFHVTWFKIIPIITGMIKRNV